MNSSPTRRQLAPQASLSVPNYLSYFRPDTRSVGFTGLLPGQPIQWAFGLDDKIWGIIISPWTRLQAYDASWTLVAYDVDELLNRES
jgi:hypothetical protein